MGAGSRLASARIPFRLKVAAVWVCLFAVLGVFFALADYDPEWMRDNFWFIAKGMRYTLQMALGGIVLAMVLALLGALARLSAQPDRVRRRRFLRLVLPGHPADRADVPDLPGAAAGRHATSSTATRASARTSSSA